MLSTLSTLLPSVLTPAPDKSIPSISTPTSSHPPPAKREEEEQRDMTVDEHGVRKKKEKSSEAFIVVRPPPSKSNHPLNLQLQLVPPQSRDLNKSLTGRSSTGDVDSQMGSLSRTTSAGSEISSYSTFSSSQASISSVGSMSSTRRMIIPLYNLQAHNVMTNVIADAGTDARVAKFLKRGIEVLGLAVFEPMEVWGSRHDSCIPMSTVGSTRDSFETSDNGALTPGSSALSLSSTGNSPAPSVTDSPAPPDLASSQTVESKKLFGKLFKKREPSSSTSASSLSVPNRSPRPSLDLQLPNRNSLLLSSESQKCPASALPLPFVLQPPVLGVQPTLSASSYPPQGRTTAYVWTVSHWIKGTDESLLKGVKGMFGNDKRGEVVELESLVEVKFEWTRGKSGDKKPKPRKEPDIQRIFPNSASVVSLNQPAESKQQPQSLKSKERSSATRPSLDSFRSSSPHRPESDHTQTTASEAEPDECESDPEDSETPWTCNLIVKRIPPGTASVRDQRSFSRKHQIPQLSPLVNPQPKLESQQVKVKVATVSPTPHHPKVVSMLKIPFPLPDIEVSNVKIRKRITTSAGVARRETALETANGKSNKEQPRDEELILTAEEIKDVVASTALWLVVREAIAGVGKVSRKGDGWKIRG